MHLVDRDRRVECVGVVLDSRAGRGSFAASITTEAVEGPHLGGEGDRVGLERQQRAVVADDLVFVFVVRPAPGMKISQ